MTYFYGVDSAAFESSTLPTLKQQWGVLPSFYMRYLGDYEITPSEIAADKANGIRFGLVYNLGDAQGGMAGEAEDAVSRMKALGLHCLLLKDIETAMATDAADLAAWSNVLAKYDVPGGFYANTEWQAFDEPYNQIVASVPRKYRLIWASEPEPGYFPPNSPPAWAPYYPNGDPSAVVMWQFTENQFGNLVDLNLCTQEAYDYLAGGPPPAPPKPTYPYPAHVTAPGSLKQQDTHTSAAAVDPRHVAVFLEVGAEVQVMGPDSHTDDVWSPVQLVRPEQVVHGWFLAYHLAKG
jgi:hypothetical protein